jgi:hypothetical protein
LVEAAEGAGDEVLAATLGDDEDFAFAPDVGFAPLPVPAAADPLALPSGAAYAEAFTAVTSTGAGDLSMMTPNAVPAARTT